MISSHEEDEEESSEFETENQPSRGNSARSFRLKDEEKKSESFIYLIIEGREVKQCPRDSANQ